MKRYMGKLIDAKLLPKTESGLNCCRWCNKEVKPPRRTLCSEECSHELKLRISGRYLRDCVYMRDKGICKICNLDTKLIAKEANMLNGINGLKYKSSPDTPLNSNISLIGLSGALISSSIKSLELKFDIAITLIIIY